MSDLQVKIFSRWVNQKLAIAKFPTIDNVVTGFADGTALVNLITALSEKELEGKPLKPGVSRMKAMDQLSRALAFVADVGCVNKLPPSAENLADGDERSIMGMVWSIMQRFLKFGDDDDGQQLSAEDSLLMWVNNQISSHNVGTIKNFGKALRDGKVYAALIHNNRPKFINHADLGDDNEANIKQVLDAATRYWDFEQYLAPSDIPKLDNKSAFIFCSEFYYGIAKMRKVDLACRRVSKLVTYTKINDALRADYNEKSGAVVERLAKVNAILNDTTIDNTMAGAQAKLAEFAAFKGDDKPMIITTFLTCESVYNQLAMRLADHHRPEFKAADGASVTELAAALKALEALEAERQVALVAELNRQIRLAQLFVQHKGRFDKLTTWTGAKDTYVNTKETITSSGDALYQINVLNAYNDESKVVQETVLVELKKLGAELEAEKFEFVAEVQTRETAVDAAFAKLATDAATKMQILEDDLARMKVKEATQLVALKHIAKHSSLAAWHAEKAAYLAVKEEINSVADAQLQLSILEMFEGDKKDTEAGPVVALKAVGAEILAANYKSDLSSWSFETPDEVTGREAEVDSNMAALAASSAEKKTVLDTALALELEKERLRLLFATQAGEYVRWTASLCEDLPKTSFGFNLAEVQAFKATLEGEDSNNTSTANEKLTAAKKTFEEAAAIGVTENAYTTLAPANLDESGAALTAATAARVTAYETELARVTEDDRLCRAFADIAKPIDALVNDNKNAITDSTEDLPAQIANVEAKVAEDHSDKVTTTADLQSQLDARNVEHNTHTHYTAKDVKVLVEQYSFFLEKKLAQLKDELEHKELRGLTKEQYAEIESQYKEFDKNGNGVLNKSEFKSCLFSLGEEKSGKQVVEIMQKFGTAEEVKYDGFKEFMIQQLGDTDTKEEIIEGWGLINKGEEVAKVAYLGETILRDEDVTYLQETAPKVGDDYDYKAWTEDVFSR